MTAWAPTNASLKRPKTVLIAIPSRSLAYSRHIASDSNLPMCQQFTRAIRTAGRRSISRTVIGPTLRF